MTRPGRARSAVSNSKWMRGLSRGKALRKLANPVALTEAVLALVAAAAVSISLVSAPGMIGVLGAGVALVMLAIALIDWHSFIIPNKLNAAAGSLALLHAAAREPEAMLQAVAIAILRGFVVAFVFYAVRIGYARLRGRQGLGLGDVKLAFVAGAWLGWVMIPVAIQLAAFAALSVYLVRQLVSGQSISATNRMPFGLFLAPTIWICWVMEVTWMGAF
jgi:leader peptidase (prepilin peptidase) / N-methyltransferase